MQVIKVYEVRFKDYNRTHEAYFNNKFDAELCAEIESKLEKRGEGMDAEPVEIKIYDSYLEYKKIDEEMINTLKKLTEKEAKELKVYSKWMAVQETEQAKVA